MGNDVVFHHLQRGALRLVDVLHSLESQEATGVEVAASSSTAIAD